jgi:hypothetical protein
MVSVWRIDTKDNLSVDITYVFYSSVNTTSH